ncbi:MAG: single-stranded DNA-binding protein [Clostridiaceae bacterium]|nr:single-stranded DNA-binding protein [Clostridiaceae bacterium]
MNNVVMIGRLARDPELRFTASGKAVATFSIAVNRPFSKTKEADFFNVVVWGKIGENCANYLAKGRLVGVQGRLQSRSYENQAGEKKYITEIVANEVEFLEWGNKQSNPGNGPDNKTDNDFGNDDIDLDNFQAIDEEDEVPF